jgi:hypothetical protein
MITSKEILNEIDNLIKTHEDTEDITNPIDDDGLGGILRREGSNLRLSIGDNSYLFPIKFDEQGFETCDLLGNVMPVNSSINLSAGLRLNEIDSIELNNGIDVNITNQAAFRNATELARNSNSRISTPLDVSKEGEFFSPEKYPRFTEPDMPDGSNLTNRIENLKNEPTGIPSMYSRW